MRQQAVRAAVLGMIDARRIVRYAASGDDDVTPFANTVFSPSDPGTSPRPSPSSAEAVQRCSSRPATAGCQPRHRCDPRPSRRLQTAPSATGAPPTSVTQPYAPARRPASPPGSASGQDNNSWRCAWVRCRPTRARWQRPPRSPTSCTNAGVLGTVVRLPNKKLYSSAFTGSRVDLVVGWSDSSIAPAAALASLVDCDQPRQGAGEEAGARWHPMSQASSATSRAPYDAG